MKNWVAYGLFFLVIFDANSQTIMNKDSLLALVTHAKKDSNEVLLYINIGQQYESSEPEVAKKYYRMANDLSKKIGYANGEIKFAANYTFVLNMQGIAVQCIFIFR